MTLIERIDAFAKLGELLRKSLNGKNHQYSVNIDNLIETQHLKNPWFTPENVRLAIRSIADELTIHNLQRWTHLYPALNRNYKPVNVGIIMAGNIPLAGFHDFHSVLITGNNPVCKLSSKDPDLIVFISNMLCSINPEFSERITFTHGILEGIDVVIATGSDNSSRYFEYYFGRYPHIIRRNRNSIAIIEGTESEKELICLGSDVFSYFGLGCRCVSKLYVPGGYDLKKLAGKWSDYSSIIRTGKWANNYDFNKAVYIVNREDFIDTGYLLIKENKGMSSPVSVLYYEFYNSMDEISQIVETDREKIQCIIGNRNIPFGRSQSPRLWDYADGFDTIEFLLKNNMAGIL